ncbi:related to Nuclear import protein MOG1 [Nakaseomyces glabratus]|nr:Ran-interacting Mog1 protein [Nakaseomyces glabratus]QNG13333.1 uncharacterized protein GWK60_F00187 [Nakaseomyces glabratus]SCV15187.1 related to Nuclear import protein MOG1 [Nakaseomyces glabratus]SLM14258.1 related to Nuclear import protein MOG1 [Nakaseomyces glabratus]
MSTCTTQLYGGAITTVLPLGFMDVSMLREVPDTQEVFVNSRTPQECAHAEDGLAENESIIIDLLQMVEAPSDDEALNVHIEDVTSLNGGDAWDTVKKETQPDGTITCILTESVHKWGKQDMRETLAICLALKRMKDVETDVLISINVPLKAEEVELLSKTEEVKRLTADYDVLKNIVKEFKVLDKSLFA